MSAQKLCKLLHLCGMAWFILAATYVLVFALRQAGVQWWLIFSLSGNGAALAFLLISTYLYTLFGSKGRDPQNAVEHLLTNSVQYMVLYSLVPFLGAMGGLYCIIEVDSISQGVMAVAMGTLGATFVFWVIIDPAVSFAEMLLPASRQHRLARHALAKAMREQRDRKNQQLLADLEKEERISDQQWQEVLGRDAQKLAALTIQAIDGDMSAEPAAVEIGLHAWQCGGLRCMQTLHRRASEICRSSGCQTSCDEYISIWWDGIGQWRHKLLT